MSSTGTCAGCASATGAGATSCIEALGDKLPQIEVRGIAAGLHILAVLPPGSDEARIREEALARRISLYTLGEHSVRPRREAALLLGYAVSPEPAIRAAVARLAEAVEAASA